MILSMNTTNIPNNNTRRCRHRGKGLFRPVHATISTQDAQGRLANAPRATWRFARVANGFAKAGTVLVFAALVGCGREEKKPADVPAAKVDGDKVKFPENAPQQASFTVEVAQPRKVAITRVTGRLYWNDEATVRIFTPVLGRVSDILVNLGQTVPAGTPLAKINSPDFAQALSDARTAAGNLRAADKSFTRAKELFDHGAAAQKDVESAEAAFVSATSERDRAEARLALYGGSNKATNDLYLLRTPLPGVVVEKNINPGQEVRADQMLANATQLFAPLFVVSDPTRLWVQLDVKESDLPTLQVGQSLKIYSQAYTNMAFEGTLESIGDSLDPATRMVKVRGIVNNPDKLLKAEMYVSVDVMMDTSRLAQGSVEVPAQALFMQDNRYYLFIEKAPGEYQRQLVKWDKEQDGKVEVYEGVTAGEKVVTEGALLLRTLLESTDKS
jgi:membrane fusion protein, heavy metal efflux system